MGCSRHVFVFCWPGVRSQWTCARRVNGEMYTSMYWFDWDDGLRCCRRIASPCCLQASLDAEIALRPGCSSANVFFLWWFNHIRVAPETVYRKIHEVKLVLENLWYMDGEGSVVDRIKPSDNEKFYFLPHSAEFSASMPSFRVLNGLFTITEFGGLFFTFLNGDFFDRMS